MASIERTPADTWKVRYRDPSGKQRRKTFQQHSNARRFAREVEVAKDRGEFVNPHDGKVLVGDWMKQWDAARLNRRASTRARDESLIRNHLLPAFGKKTLGSAQPVDVKAFVASLARRNYSPAYIAKAYQLLAASFLAAVDEGMLPRTPCRGVALPRIEKHEMRFLSHAEVAALAETIHPRYRALVLTAAYTGLRAGELSGLHVDQLNLLRRTLTVTRTATEVRGHWSIGTPKTKASRRTVTLPKTLCEVLAAHLAEYGTKELIFTSPEGNPVRWTNFRRRQWLPALEEADLGHVRFHDLRHSHAAWLIAANEHPKVIQSRLGHAAITTTLDTYGHLMDGLDGDAADRLDSAFLDAHVPFMRPLPGADVVALATR